MNTDLLWVVGFYYLTFLVVVTLSILQSIRTDPRSVSKKAV